MEHTYEDLKSKTVAQLREIAAGIDHPAVQGYTQLHKDHLLPAICTALDIEMHVHHEVVGVNKAKVKARIRELKAERDRAMEAKDPAKLKAARVEIKNLKKKLRRAMV